MNFQISAYNVNCNGILCYAGLPVNNTDNTYDMHNSYYVTYPNIGTNKRPQRHYEVSGISIGGFLHGIPNKVFDVYGNELRYFI